MVLLIPLILAYLTFGAGSGVLTLGTAWHTGLASECSLVVEVTWITASIGT